MALRAKFKFETDVFFMILRRKIMKNTSVSKENSAAEGGKRLFTQPPIKSLNALKNKVQTAGSLISEKFRRHQARIVVLD